MEEFIVYEQRPPMYDGAAAKPSFQSFKANIVQLGKVEASSIEEAIKEARKKFKIWHPVLAGEMIRRMLAKANERD